MSIQIQPYINIYCFQDLVALTKIYTSQLSNLMPVMIGREYLFELHWFYCVLVVPIQKVRTHFNISSKRLNERNQLPWCQREKRVAAPKSESCYHSGLEAGKVHLILSCWREGPLLLLPLLEQYWCHLVDSKEPKNC